MEYYVKAEPVELMEMSQECILCDEGKKYLSFLVNHFQTYHKGKAFLEKCSKNTNSDSLIDYSMFEDGPILQYCRCPESQQFQIQIVTHLLSHSMLNTECSQEKESDNVAIKEDVEYYDEAYLNEAVEEDYDRFEQQEIYSEEEEQTSPEASPKRRGRKRKDSSSSGNNKRRKVKSLTCKVCLREFDNPKKYYNHTAAAHREKFQCDKCQLKYNFKYQLRRHIEVSHLDRPRVKVNRPKKFQCDVCSMQFTELRILTEHTNIHLDLRPFVCEFCSEAFHNSANLRYHRKRHLNPDGK
jgi:hypothetical protein